MVLVISAPVFLLFVIFIVNSNVVLNWLFIVCTALAQLSVDNAF